jgi:hypothetical protein
MPCFENKRAARAVARHAFSDAIDAAANLLMRVATVRLEGVDPRPSLVVGLPSVRYSSIP